MVQGCGKLALSTTGAPAKNRRSRPIPRNKSEARVFGAELKPGGTAEKRILRPCDCFNEQLAGAF